jgi:CheY-like chemotaxis protein
MALGRPVQLAESMQSDRKAQQEPSLHVLIVESEPSILARTSALLLAEGAEISTARSAAGLHDRVARTLPDLVLMDVMMPGLDGRELAQLANLCRRGAPALVVHTKMLRAMLRRFLDVRALFGIIPKSNDDEEFLRLYREISDRLASELPTQIFVPRAIADAMSGTYSLTESDTPATTGSLAGERRQLSITD